MDSDLQITHNGRKMLEDKPTQVGLQKRVKKMLVPMVAVKIRLDKGIPDVAAETMPGLVTADALGN